MTPRKRLLTDVERRYLIDVARGLTAAESARTWGVGVDTVNELRQRAKRALWARNLPHAVCLAFAEGEFTADDVLKGDD